MIRTIACALAAAALAMPAAAIAEDQAGATAKMSPARVLAAKELIKTGGMISLGRVYEADMPLFGSRAFALRATGGLAGGAFGDNHVIWMDDFLATEIGQVGTQFDGLGHIGVGGPEGNRFYGGRTLEDIAGPYGLAQLGIEHVRPIFTRGVLVDMVAHKGAPLEGGEEIALADFQAAMETQGVEIRDGDAVVIHTGWGRHWITDNDTYNGSEPGPGIELGRWLAEQGVMLVGADTWGMEVHPNPQEGQVFPVHQIFLVEHGIFIHENLATEGLVEAGVNEFVYSYTPVPVKGATGSPGAPIALH